MAGLFVAGGFSGLVSYSTDGLTWTQVGSGLSAIIRDVVYSPDLDLWVLVADSGGIATSTDGITWTTRTNPFGSNGLLAVQWATSLGLFIAAGANGNLATSPDGITWTLRTSGFGSSSIWDIAWSEELALLVAVGDDSKVGTSTDGITWSVTTPIAGSWPIRTVDWAPGLGSGLFVMAGGRIVGTSDEPKIYTSPSGTGSWSTHASGWGDQFLQILCGSWSPSLDLFAIAGDRYIATTSDGSTYTRRYNGVGGETWQGLAWSEELALWAGAKDTAGFHTSTDGITWTTTGQSYGGTQGQFCLAWGGIAQTSGILLGAVI